MLGDRILIWKVKNGDKQALRRLYDKYKDDLLTVAVSMLNDKSDAEDVLRDVFVSFVEIAKRFSLSGSLRNYLMTSVINRIRDRYRRKMYQVVELDGIASSGPDNLGPAGQALENEQSQILIDALSKIPVQQREVIVLYLQAAMKFREIAEMQDTSVGTVRARYYYGIDKLRSILNGIIVE